MFLRIAPELYLKRLIVGGFERVFEINRNFRNEGISVRHNPEFTMMEFYAAYWNYQDLMDFTEALIRDAAQKAAGTLQLTYGGKPVDLAKPFERLTIREAILKHTDAGDNVTTANGSPTPCASWARMKKRTSCRPARWPACRCCTLKRRWKKSCGSPPSSWSTRPKSRRWPAPTTAARGDRAL
jgi:lysyl-tRNA synthetase class II